MKCTSMKVKGKKLNDVQFLALILDLRNAIGAAGFETEVEQVNSQCIKLGQHMRSFSISLARHGYNTQHRMGSKRRTNLPCWDQRVKYNDIINTVLNDHGISCNIKSGPYTIRKGETAFTEKDWEFQKPEWQHSNEARGFYIEQGDYKKVV